MREMCSSVALKMHLSVTQSHTENGRVYFLCQPDFFT